MAYEAYNAWLAEVNKNNPFAGWTDIGRINEAVSVVGASNIIQIEDVPADCWAYTDQQDAKLFGWDGEKMSEDTASYYREFRLTPSPHGFGSEGKKVEWVLQLR